MTQVPVRMEFDATVKWLRERRGTTVFISAGGRMDTVTHVPPLLGMQCKMTGCVQREDGYLFNLEASDPAPGQQPTGMLEVGPSQFQYGEENHHDDQQPSLVIMFDGGLHITVSPLA